jgi:hypothetical protein
MNRLPKKRGITQIGEDKSLILRQNVGKSPEVTSDENLYAEIDDSRTISDVPIKKGYLTKISAERARRERPDFIAPATTNEVQKALVGKPLEKVVRLAPAIQEKELAPQSTKIITLDGGFSHSTLSSFRTLM